MESEPKKSTIGDRLRLARLALGLTQQELGETVESSKRGIQNNESLDRVPGGAVVPRLVDMGISANWLLANKGPMFMTDGSHIEVAAPVFNRYAMTRALERVRQANPACSAGCDWDENDQRLADSLWRTYHSTLEQIAGYRDEWIRLVFSFDPPMPDAALQEYFSTWIERQVQQSRGET